jgi:hypothetical protein
VSPAPASAVRPGGADPRAATRSPARAAPRSVAGSAAPARRPVAPRRVSGPARQADPAAPAERFQRPRIARPSSAPFTQHVARVVDHSLLDRLIRGRAWIGLIAFALIGIVAMQVTLLKLNSGIGRSIQRATALQRETSLLAAQVAGLASAQRVQAEATKLGMVFAPPDDVRYLRVSKGDAARAVTSFVAPATTATATTATGAAGTAGTAAAGSTSGSAAPASAASSTGSASTPSGASSSGSTSSASASSPTGPTGP